MKLPVGNPWTADSCTQVLVWTQQVAAHDTSHSTSFVAVPQTGLWVSVCFLSQWRAVTEMTARGVEQQPGTADLMPWNMCCPSSWGHTLQDMLLNLWHKPHIMREKKQLLEQEHKFPQVTVRAFYCNWIKHRLKQVLFEICRLTLYVQTGKHCPTILNALQGRKEKLCPAMPCTF